MLVTPASHNAPTQQDPLTTGHRARNWDWHPLVWWQP